MRKRIVWINTHRKTHTYRAYSIGRKANVSIVYFSKTWMSFVLSITSQLARNSVTLQQKGNCHLHEHTHSFSKLMHFFILRYTYIWIQFYSMYFGISHEKLKIRFCFFFHLLYERLFTTITLQLYRIFVCGFPVFSIASEAINFHAHS